MDTCSCVSYDMALLLCISLFTLGSGSVVAVQNDRVQSALVQRNAVDACLDNPACATLPDICHSPDQAIAKSLCPVKCGFCSNTDPYPGCEDSPLLNCTDVTHQVCTFGSAFLLCPRTCNLCDRNPNYHPCVDHVQGISCTDLPDPCSDAVGIISCPLFCGVCSTKPTPEPATSVLTTTTLQATTPLPVTTPTSGPCDVSPCINGGSCIANGYMFTCSCPHGYGGPFCNIVPPPPQTTIRTTTAPTIAATTASTTAPGYCATRPCLNGGICSEVSGGFVCLCLPGFEHPVCEKATTTITTTTTTTQPTTTTTTTTAVSTATTPAGLCASNPCHNGGTCLTGFHPLGQPCRCAHGFHGHYCQYATATTTPTTAAPTTVDYCALNPCQNGGTCRSTNHNHRCHCVPGFTGKDCQTAAATTTPTTTATTTADYCASNPCQNGGICRTNNRHHCHCVHGFTGMHCQNATHAATTTTTTPAPTATITTTTPPNCSLLNKHQLGCSPADVIFMVEHFSLDPHRCSLSHQETFIREIVQWWENTGIRTGVVAYYDNDIVKPSISLSEYQNDTDGFIRTLKEKLRDGVRPGPCPNNADAGAEYEPSGSANLATALDFVRNTSFNDARPGVPRVVIPLILSQMDGRWYHNLRQASQRLKDTCTSIMPVVQLRESCHEGKCLNWAHHIASQPWTDFYHEYNITSPAGQHGVWWHNHACFGTECGRNKGSSC